MRRRTAVKKIRKDEMLFDLLIEPRDEGGFLATSPDVQGLIAQGNTIAETIDIARDLARKIVESCIEHGDPLPNFRRTGRCRVIAAPTA